MKIVNKIQVAGKKNCFYKNSWCPFDKFIRNHFRCIRFSEKIDMNERVGACKLKHGDKVFIKIDDTE